MTLLTPLALALSLLAVPIVLMYVLKLRRQEQVISSTLLWRRALDDIQANAPWQRLRPSILLLLQLLALAALVLMLARPAYSRSRSFAGDHIVIVDESYGMQARDVAPSRFAVALAQARTITDDLGSGEVMSVIGMGAQPRLAIAESDDQGAIKQAIDSLHVGVNPPNFLAAFSLAASLARSGATTRVDVLTSRDSGIASLPLEAPFSTHIDRVGGRLRDLGITSFSAGHVGQPNGAGTPLQAVVRVSNFGSRAAHSDLDLFVDGQLADVRPLSIPAGQVQNLFWAHLPTSAERLQARLTVTDDVAEDKSAWAVIPTGSVRHVLLVSSGDYFLQTALALDPSVRLEVLHPADYTPTLVQRYDLVVFDGFLPSSLPATSAMLVAPPQGRAGPIRFGAPHFAGTVAEAPAGTTGPLASLLRYVDLSDVHVARARAVSLPSWLQPIAVSGSGTGPLLAVGDSGSSRLAVVTFDLQQSDWPLRISFPIVLQNLLHYLAPGLTLGAADVNAGRPVSFFPAPGTTELEIVRPSGASSRLRPPFPPFTDTGTPGLYTGRESGGTRPATATFAVNFFPSRPGSVPGPAVLAFDHAQAGSSRATSVPVSVAWAFGLLALGLLGLEWWMAFRSR